MSIGATEPVSYTGMFGTAPTAGTDTGATTTTSKSADKDMFLQLLVAQMKYQDPMNPTDSSQFLAQSAQFTALEKMQNVADQTAQLVASQMAFGASGLVGRTVTWTDADGAAQSGTVSGVTFGTDGPMLDVGDSQISLGQVQSVTDGTATPAASSGSTTSTTGSAGSSTTV
jgi:flagellar basal-body rod modification protein FlgD